MSTVHTSLSPYTYSTPLTPFHRESPSPLRSISTILTLSRGTAYRSEAMKTFIIVDNSALFCPVITISGTASRSRTSGLKSVPSPRGSGSDEEHLLNCGDWSRARRGTPEGSSFSTSILTVLSSCRILTDLPVASDSVPLSCPIWVLSAVPFKITRNTVHWGRTSVSKEPDISSSSRVV